MSGFLGDALTPLYYVVSAGLVAWHEIFSFVLANDSGWIWALAIVGLSATVRVLLLPLYLLQIRARWDMRELMPRFKKLEETYRDDSERLMQEQRRLFKEIGTNPFVFWMPMILQGLVLFVVFRVLDAAAKNGPDAGRGFVTDDQARSLSEAEVLGARVAETLLDASYGDAVPFTILLVVFMCVMQFVAQRQQLADGPTEGVLGEMFARQQRLVRYGVPVLFAAAGLVLPLGALIYWATSGASTVFQQHLFHDDADASPGPPSPGASD